MPLNIGLDYDGTITSAPEIFLAFAKSMQAAGHKVYIVTMRYPSECDDIPDVWHLATEGIFATSRGAKDIAMKNQGIDIHISGSMIIREPSMNQRFRSGDMLAQKVRPLAAYTK